MYIHHIGREKLIFIGANKGRKEIKERKHIKEGRRKEEIKLRKMVYNAMAKR
jgi:hypothetical protein